MFKSRKEILDHFEQVANQIDLLAEETLMALNKKKKKSEEALANANAYREQFLEKIKTIKEYNLNNLNKESIFCFLVHDFVEEPCRKKGQFCHLALIKDVLSKEVHNSVINRNAFEMYKTIADDNKPMIIRDLFRKKFKNAIMDLTNPEENILDDVYITIGGFEYDDSSFDFLTKLLNIKKIEKVEMNNFQGLKVPSECFRNFPNLKKLSYTLGKCDRLYARSFERLANLKEIFLTSQGIQVVEKDTFFNLVNLVKLEMPGARIEKIEPGAFNGLTNLKYLDLRQNRIKIIQNNTFSQLNNLEFLNLNENLIQKIEKNSFKDLKNLKVLFMKFNGINIDIEPEIFDSLGNLQVLDLEYSLFKNFDSRLFKFTTNLKLLNMKNHLIEDVSFLNELNKLELLDISDSGPITNIDEIKLEKLKILSISLENVTKFEPNFESLQALYINNCVEFEEDCFENLKNLIFLKIGVNYLDVILDLKDDFVSISDLRYFGLCLNTRNLDERQRRSLFDQFDKEVRKKMYFLEDLMDPSLNIQEPEIGLRLSEKTFFLEMIDYCLRSDKIESIFKVSKIVAENLADSIYTGQGSIKLVRMRNNCTLM